jgi:23S rRNA (cytosine1962-C5)-methyltransferase
LKTFSFHPCVYPAMIRGASPGAKAGDLVNVYDREGQPFGVGLYNPRANVPLRMIYHGPDEVGEDLFLTLIDRALDLRLNDLRLPERGDAFRVIHSDGDGLGGLIVDKFGDVLSVQMHSLGMFQRFPQWLPRLHERLGTRRMVLEVDPAIARLEGISARTLPVDAVRTIRIREHGVRYEVDLGDRPQDGLLLRSTRQPAAVDRVGEGQARARSLLLHRRVFPLGEGDGRGRRRDRGGSG